LPFPARLLLIDSVYSKVNFDHFHHENAHATNHQRAASATQNTYLQMRSFSMTPATSQSRRAAAATFIGTTIKFYDFYIYATTAARSLIADQQADYCQ
jgi:hypothetical protein